MTTALPVKENQCEPNSTDQEGYCDALLKNWEVKTCVNPN